MALVRVGSNGPSGRGTACALADVSLPCAMSPKTRPTRPRSYTKAREIQQLIYEDIKQPDLKPSIRAGCARAWDVIEERCRILLGKPMPGQLRPDLVPRKPRARNGRRGPVAPESMSPVIAESTSPVIADATSQASSSSTVVEPQPAASTSPAPSTAPTTAPVPAAAAPQDEPSI